MENWQNLPKNQDDNETIEGAIAREVTAHESDPDAHLGASESLQSHKASKVIDHIARSIVGDKINNLTSFTVKKLEFVVTSWAIDGWDDIIGFTGLGIAENELVGNVLYFLVDNEMDFSAVIVSNTTSTITVTEFATGAGDKTGETAYVTLAKVGPGYDSAYPVMGDQVCINGEAFIIAGANSYVEIELEMDRISIIGQKDRTLGIFEVYIDDVYQETIDCYSATAQYNVTLFEALFETTAIRTIKIVCTGTKNALSIGYDIWLVTMDINGIVSYTSGSHEMFSEKLTFPLNSSGLADDFLSAPSGYRIESIVGMETPYNANQTYVRPIINYLPLAEGWQFNAYGGRVSTTFTVIVYYYAYKIDEKGVGVNE